MYIGKLAEKTGATRKAIRHYEALGLIPKPQRKGSYRIYEDADADLICMIKRAQSLGFSLKEISDIASSRAKTGNLPVDMIVKAITAKRQQLRDTVDSALSRDKLLAELQADLLRSTGTASTKTKKSRIDSAPKVQV
jgi:MerR family transcriptional regulator, copper efflux regulator